MRQIFGVPYFNIKTLCRDLKRWENDTCATENVTISYFKKEGLYYAQQSHVFMPNADEQYRANFLIHFKGNKKKATDFLVENGLKPKNCVTN